MVANLNDYAWSSFSHNALGTPNSLIQPHASYLSLGKAPIERCDAYRAFVMQAIPEKELDDIRLHLQRQHVYGSARFRAVIEVQLGRRAGPAKIGRPRRLALTDKSAL